MRIRISRIEDGEILAEFETKSARLGDAVYKYKKLHGLDGEATEWVVTDHGAVVRPVDDPRIPAFAELKSNTRKTYQQHLRNFFKWGGDPKSYDSIASYVRTLPVPSRHGVIYAIMRISPDDEALKDRLKILSRDVYDDVRLEKATRVREPAITLARIRAIASEPKYSKNFIAQWYSRGVPWRADTMTNIIKGRGAKVSEKLKMNTFYPLKRTIHLEHFKTRDSHGAKDISLTLEEVRLLKMGFGKSKRLLNMSADTLIHRIRDIFGVGLNALRHAHITDARQKMDADTFKDYVWKLNTSVAVALETYDDN